MFNGKSTIAVTDVETTGLDVERDIILEVGVVQCRADTLERVDAIRVVVSSADTRAWCDEVMRKNDAGEELDIPERMHLANGLVRRILEPEDTEYGIHADSLSTAEWALVEWTKNRDLVNRPLVGASVGSLDRPMLLRHLPGLCEIISYKNVDTSSFLEALKLFDNERASRIVKGINRHFPATAEHLTLEDAERSLAMLRYTMEQLGLVDSSLPVLFPEDEVAES